MKDLISVIVPIYNIDRYLGLCIESILNQDYASLEILLVNDGSPDRCRELCDLYSRKDKRIKVIHKPNGGLVSARKAGLRASNGDYIAYVDGDDWIEPCFIGNLHNVAIETDSDIVCAGFTRDLFSKAVQIGNSLPRGVYDREKLIFMWNHMISFRSFYHPGITTYVWNKLFRREVLLDPQSCVDNRITIGEDAAVTYPALFKCKRVAVIENYSYHYRQREDSMLKQSARYSQDAERLNCLYRYLMRWADNSAEQQLSSQIEDYILANCIMRSGGRLPQENYSVFNDTYYGKKVVIYSAGTFGQQLVNRIKESGICNIVSWIDDDYWEYRRCCLDVDPVESVSSLQFDYLLIAKVDSQEASVIRNRLKNLGVEDKTILTVSNLGNKKQLIEHFLDVEAIKAEERKYLQEVISHA